ncbi:MAG: HD-GYP domain-containing protein [Desulfuromonadales bacterium]|jgi:putative nucleotidyltransferase with HDIG domain
MDQEQIKQVTQSFAGAFKGLRLYPLQHPAIERQIRSLHTGLLALAEETGEVRMGLLEGTLYLQDHLFAQSTPAADEISRLLREFELEGFHFRKDVSTQELQHLFSSLVEGGARGAAFKERLQGHGVQNILPITETAPEEKTEAEEGEGNPRKVYGRALEVMQNVFEDVRLGRIPSSTDAIQVVKSMAQLTLTEPHALFALSMLKDYDNYTFTHSVNVGVIALAVGRACGLSEERLRILGLGSILHDLGKLKIDKQIINKPGRLTEEEFAEIRQHPQGGADMVRQMEGTTPEVIDIVLGHHIRYDRQGYPAAAQERAFSPLTSMAAIADTYDAMTTLRSYQRPMTPRRAMEKLRGLAGAFLHPEFVEAFIESLGPYPVGSLVRLETNEIGLVTWVDTKDPARVRLKVLFGADGNLLPQPGRVEIDGNQPPRIVAEVDPSVKGIEVADFFD